jgi:hypothetical protein
MGKNRDAYRVLAGKPEEKGPLGITRRGWEDNNRMYIREIGWGGGVWTGFIWLRIGTSGGLL